MTQYLLDSGDPSEYKAIAQLAKEKGEVLFGATTNPTLIAKKLAGKKISQQEAFSLQKDIVLEITTIVPGPVSAEVYADSTTSAADMVKQGEEIAGWHERVVVKLPTTLEGFKARTTLRRENIPINNTLVFSQQQIFAVCLHEKIMQKERVNNAPTRPEPVEGWPPFISPFVGRLDDQGEDGSAVVEHAMRLKRSFGFTPLILLSSVRSAQHMKRGIDCEVDLVTAPAKVYEEWFSLTDEQKDQIDTITYAKTLKPIADWQPDQSLLSIDTIDLLMTIIETGKLDITHPLTDKGLTRFADDWKAIIST